MRTVGNILWLIIVGWLTAVQWVLAGAVLCITIIGIPFGLQAFKLAGLALVPFGREVVRSQDVRSWA